MGLFRLVLKRQQYQSICQMRMGYNIVFCYLLKSLNSCFIVDVLAF